MKLINGKDRIRIRNTDITVYRQRGCDSCKNEILTAEFQLSGHAGNSADRCPVCIVGPGKEIRSSRARSRPLFGKNCRLDADMAGAVARRRECSGCRDRKGRVMRWTTWEVRADGQRCRDVTVCDCGGRMIVMGKWNPHLKRLERR